MEYAFFEDQKFERTDFRIKPLAMGDYENCIFTGCNFSDSDLSEIKFKECEFVGCNLSMVRLVKTVFRDTKFRECKMLGLPAVPHPQNPVNPK